MKLYSGMVRVYTYHKDKVYIAYRDPYTCKQVDILVPRECLAVARDMSYHNAAVVLMEDSGDMSIMVGMDSQDELVDE